MEMGFNSVPAGQNKEESNEGDFCADRVEIQNEVTRESLFSHIDEGISPCI